MPSSIPITAWCDERKRQEWFLKLATDPDFIVSAPSVTFLKALLTHRRDERDRAKVIEEQPWAEQLRLSFYADSDGPEGHLFADDFVKLTTRLNLTEKEQQKTCMRTIKGRKCAKENT